jgi:hypothetical protein
VSDAPSRCPTCSTDIPPGATRCPGCGRVFGEDNRCPHCNAIAAVKPAGDGYVCVACSKPRERKPLTTVLGEEPGRASIVPSAGSSLRGRGLRSVGALSIAGGVLSAALATALLGITVAGIATASVVGLLGVLVGFTLMRRAGRADDAARALTQRTAVARVRSAATKLGGDVTAKAIAKELGVPVEDADAVLTQMADGTNVTVEVDTDTAQVHYVFPEIVAARPKLRVADDVGRGTDPDVDPDQAEIEALKERKSRI